MWKKVLPATVFFFLLFVPFGSGATFEASQTIFSDGQIRYPSPSITTPSTPGSWVPSGATLVLSDDFETTQLVDGKLTGWVDHDTQDPEYISFSSSQAHSGSKSLVVTRGGGDSGTRVYLWRDYNEYWMSVWLYFPSNFDLDAWFSFQNPIYEWISSGTSLTFESQLLSGNKLLFNLMKFKKTDYVHEPGSPEYYDSEVYMPRDRWVNIKTHVIRATSNGLIDIYVDEQLVLHYTGETRWQQDNFMIQPIKFYCAYDPTNLTKTLYFDDIEIWTTA